MDMCLFYYDFKGAEGFGSGDAEEVAARWESAEGDGVVLCADMLGQDLTAHEVEDLECGRG